MAVFLLNSHESSHCLSHPLASTTKCFCCYFCPKACWGWRECGLHVIKPASGLCEWNLILAIQFTGCLCLVQPFNHFGFCSICVMGISASIFYMLCWTLYIHRPTLSSPSLYNENAGIPHLTDPHSIAPRRYCIYSQIEGLWQPCISQVDWCHFFPIGSEDG